MVGHDANAKDDQGEANEAFSPVIETLWQSDMEFQNCYSQDGNHEGVAKCIGDSEAKATLPVALHGGDVRNGGEVIVVKPVP